MLLPGPNGISKASAAQLPAMPTIKNKRRRPRAPPERSDSAPASGATSSATKAPRAAMVPVTPSRFAADAPKMAETWSGIRIGKIVSHWALNASHNNDIWACRSVAGFIAIPLLQPLAGRKFDFQNTLHGTWSGHACIVFSSRNPLRCLPVVPEFDTKRASCAIVTGPSSYQK